MSNRVSRNHRQTELPSGAGLRRWVRHRRWKFERLFRRAADKPSISGSINLNRRTVHRTRNSLDAGQPRDLLVLPHVRAAFERDGAIVEESLRHWANIRPPNDRIPDRIPVDNIVRTCDEPALWAAGLVPHYGHFLTEGVSRLWPVLPGGSLEGLSVVQTTADPRSYSSPFVADWTAAFGLNRMSVSDAGATRFTRMYVPEPAWWLNSYIAPEIRDIHLHARQGLDVSPGSSDVLWLSRAGLRPNRLTYDEVLLEWLLAEHVTSIHPQQLSLADQVGAVEGSRVVAGIVGSAFHTLLMARSYPRCVYLCPARFQSAYVAQAELVGAEATFAHALAATEMRPRGRASVTRGYRVLVPEALRALTTAVKSLGDDSRTAALQWPESFWRQALDKGDEGEMTRAVAGVVLDPLSWRVRMRLGRMFEERGANRAALEQYRVVVDLADDLARAPASAARVLFRMGETEQAAAMAERALAIDPDTKNVRRFLLEA